MCVSSSMVVLPPPSLKKKKKKNHHHNSKQESQYSSSTSISSMNNNKSNNYLTINTLLSFVWLVLCTFLVHKHNELIIVFFAFVGSFVLSAIIKKLLIIVNNHHHQQQQQQQVLLINTRIKNIVGLIACITSIWFLASLNNNATTTNYKGRQYVSLSIVTGYLTYDLWYSYLCCYYNDDYYDEHHDNDEQQQPTSSKTKTTTRRPRRRRGIVFINTIEDSLTLILFVVLLALVSSNHNNNNSNNKVETLSSYHTYGCLWLTYKTMRLMLSLSFGGGSINSSSTTVFDEKNITVIADKQQSTTAPGGVNDLWQIHGKYYDLSNFVKHHPGGVESIELGRGRDCTALFESYHPFTNQHRLVLSKYQPISIQNKSKTIDDDNDFEEEEEDLFYNILKERVFKELKKNGIDPKIDRCASTTRILYYLTIFTCLSISLYYYVLQNSILNSLSLAIFGWLIGSLGHDGGHYTVSRRQKGSSYIPITINDISVYIGMFFLCNPIMWQHQHTYAHHSYTNDFYHDPDLHHFHTLLRVHRNFTYREIYKNQISRIYVIFVYTFVVFGECLWIPLSLIREGTLYGLVEWTDRKRPLRSICMFLHLILYVTLIILMPFVMAIYNHSHNDSLIITLLKTLTSVTIHISTCGLLFGVFSQINHLNELSINSATTSIESSSTTTTTTTTTKSDEEEDSKNCNNNNSNNRVALIKNSLHNSWAKRQIETSNNFACQSFLWYILSNGLNLQIEHHLFPGLNHEYLCLIQPIVEETCLEYGVLYKSYETWNDLMDASLQWFNKLATSNNK